MPTKTEDANERIIRLLRTLAIVQLGVAGVPQQDIRGIVGGAMGDVTDIVKRIPREKKRGTK